MSPSSRALHHPRDVAGPSRFTLAPTSAWSNSILRPPWENVFPVCSFHCCFPLHSYLICFPFPRILYNSWSIISTTFHFSVLSQFPPQYNLSVIAKKSGEGGQGWPPCYAMSTFAWTLLNFSRELKFICIQANALLYDVSFVASKNKNKNKNF